MFALLWLTCGMQMTVLSSQQRKIAARHLLEPYAKGTKAALAQSTNGPRRGRPPARRARCAHLASVVSHPQAAKHHGIVVAKLLAALSLLQGQQTYHAPGLLRRHSHGAQTVLVKGGHLPEEPGAL